MVESNNYKNGVDFPYEGFVQKSIENCFSKLGYSQVKEKHVDFMCINTLKNEKWIIEAKGKTTAIGLDFNTCVGQIIKRMETPNIKYAIAVPKIEQYIKQCKLIKQWIREALNLYWIFIDSDGKMIIVEPGVDEF
jgi:hypothetical protein